MSISQPSAPVSPIIPSLLDTDLYKFTMMQVVLHQFPGAQVEYTFRCRSAGIDLSVIAEDFQRELAALCRLRMQEEELAYLQGLRFIKPDFVDFLRVFQLDARYVEVKTGAATGNTFELKIKGPWLHTILFEVPLLAIINELYFRHVGKDLSLDVARARLRSKIATVQGFADAARFRFSDFGTRRRFSHAWQNEVIATLKKTLPHQFTGTSNLYFAMRHQLTAIGTMAHEYLQAFQALGPRLIDSQKVAFQAWAQEYRGDLGIALSDVVGMDAFLRDFDLYFCKLFDGARHDSGEPFAWGEKLLAHYARMRIPANTKTLVFSDGLTFEKAMALHERFIGRCLPKFGIGTNLTCDVGIPAINIVLKMTRCNGQPVAKLSDEPGKTMCDDPLYLSYLKQVFSAPEALAPSPTGATLS